MNEIYQPIHARSNQKPPNYFEIPDYFGDTQKIIKVRNVKKLATHEGN